MSPCQRGGRHYAFGVDPVGISVGLGVGMMLSCVQVISLTNGRIGTNFALGHGGAKYSQLSLNDNEGVCLQII